MIGIARQSVSRELKKVKKDQLIEMNGQYIIINKSNYFETKFDAEIVDVSITNILKTD